MPGGSGCATSYTEVGKSCAEVDALKRKLSRKQRASKHVLAQYQYTNVRRAHTRAMFEGKRLAQHTQPVTDLPTAFVSARGLSNAICPADRSATLTLGRSQANCKVKLCEDFVVPSHRVGRCCDRFLRPHCNSRLQILILALDSLIH